MVWFSVLINSLFTVPISKCGSFVDVASSVEILCCLLVEILCVSSLEMFCLSSVLSVSNFIVLNINH